MEPKTVKDMAMEYYPRLWNRQRLETLVAAGRLSEEDFNEIIAAKTPTANE